MVILHEIIMYLCILYRVWFISGILRINNKIKGWYLLVLWILRSKMVILIINFNNKLERLYCFYKFFVIRDVKFRLF